MNNLHGYHLFMCIFQSSKKVKQGFVYIYNQSYTILKDPKN